MSSCLVARLDTSHVPCNEEGKVSDDEDTFFVEDSTWATLFRLARKDCLELEELNAQLKSQLQQLRGVLDLSSVLLVKDKAVVQLASLVAGQVIGLLIAEHVLYLPGIPCLPFVAITAYHASNKSTEWYLDSAIVVLRNTCLNSGVLDPVLPASTSPVSSPEQGGLDTSDSVSIDDGAELVSTESPNDYSPPISDASIPATTSPSPSTAVYLFDK
ncbi:hypothetical protein FRX31_002330, partial [Thalictrum thalictroides]